MSGAIPSPAMGAPTARVPLGGVLTPRMERLIRIGSVGSAMVIAVCAMVLSYSGLLDLALDAEIQPRLALLVPIMVDGLQFVGSLGVVYSTLSGLRSWYPWMLMLLGVSVSAWGNWQAAPDVLTAKLLHASAPVILALVLEELLRVTRHKVHLHALAADPDPSSEPLAEASEEPSQGDTEGSDVEAIDPGASHVEARDSMPAAARDAALAPVSTPEAAETEKQAEESAPTSALPEEPDRAPEGEGPQGNPQLKSEGSPEVGQREPVALPPYPLDASFREQVRAILIADPEFPPSTIARALGKDPSYTRKTIRGLRAELDSQPQQEAVDPAPAPGPHGTTSAPAGTVSPDVPPGDTDDADPFASPVPAYAGR